MIPDTFETDWWTTDDIKCAATVEYTYELTRDGFSYEYGSESGYHDLGESEDFEVVSVTVEPLDGGQPPIELTSGPHAWLFGYQLAEIGKETLEHARKAHARAIEDYGLRDVA